ncbi:MAG: hypothetical protein JWO38_6627, partial [Gemmataceae bacterium]|nr:hypothetical protein [Gemmataceae bacterium]
MSTASPARGRARRRQAAVLCLLLALLGVVGRLIWVHASAWANFDRGRAAL